jgi:small GTP-binding protein
MNNKKNSGFFTNVIEDWRSPPTKTSIKIVLIGDGATGKTSYFSRITSGDTDEYKFNRTYDATRGCNICQIEYLIGRYNITVHLFDTAGQEKFGDLRDSYLMGADGVILMYDLTDIVTKKNVFNKWIPEIKRIVTDSKISPYIPIAVVGNKNDRIDINSLRCTDPKRRELDDLTHDQMLTNTIGIRLSALKNVYDPHNYGYIEHFYVSVKGDENLLAPINWLLRNILSYYIPVDVTRPNKQIKTVWCNT